MSLTSREYQQVILAGGHARRAGTPKDANPHARDDSPDGRRRFDAWAAGWDQEDGGKGRMRRR